MTQAIILAAGRGSRLKNMTSYKPKSFNKFNKKRYIDIIIENFLKNNLKKINIVVGYKKKLFERYKYKKLFNSKWKSSSIFFSLYKANKILSNESCIISYSDIIFKKSAIKLLKESKGEIVILNNSNWKKTWKLRFKKPLKDLESFDYSKNSKGFYLTKIGSKVKNISQIKGQFAGLFKITPRGWKIIIDFIKKEKLNIKNIDMTSFFSKLIKKHNNVVKVVHYNKMWFEIDTVKDFKLLNSYKIKFL